MAGTALLIDIADRLRSLDELVKEAVKNGKAFHIPENLPPEHYVRAHIGAMWFEFNTMKAALEKPHG